jgi:general secretion pathway protein A
VTISHCTLVPGIDLERDGTPQRNDPSLTIEAAGAQVTIGDSILGGIRAHVDAQVSLENCLLEFDDLLLEIISQMRGERVSSAELPDRYSRLSSFKQLLMRQVAESGRHLVILLDEAEQLSPASIEALKGLTNIASERQNFLTLVLIGQPELRATIRQLPQVDQRISLRYHLNALSHDETRRYLEHRLQVAGLQGPSPFDEDAVRRLFETSGGVPREINRICKLALDHARANGIDRLDAGLINTVTEDLQRHGGLLDPCAIPA